MNYCEFEEIDGKPGYQWCPHCQRVRGYPKGQSKPSPLPENLRRECTAVAPRRSRGLGDTVAKVIHTVTGGLVKPCGGCKERQAKLNKLLPYNDPDDGRNA